MLWSRIARLVNNVEFTPMAISKKLLEKKLLPCMLLKFALIVFYMGMKPLAGYSLEYLTRMKQKIVEILEDSFPEESELANQIPIDSMNVISICQGRDKQGNLKELHAFDIFYRQGLKEEYFKKLDKYAFKDFLPDGLNPNTFPPSPLGDFLFSMLV